MKTIGKALLDEVFYPVSNGYVENVCLRRGLDIEGECSADVLNSDQFKGALADCFISLVQAISISEAGNSYGSLSDKDKERLLNRANSIYKSLGEKTVQLDNEPKVYIGDF